MKCFKRKSPDRASTIVVDQLDVSPKLREHSRGMSKLHQGLLPALCCLLASLFACPPLNAQNPPASELTVTDQGANHRTWGRVAPLRTNAQGQVTYRTNIAFVELASGLHHKIGTNWVESSEKIQITADGGAATNGPHKVHFAANINSTGAIQFTAPDGKQLDSHIIGLSYFDPSANTNVLLAILQDRIGNVAGNQVIYSNAFKGVHADVRYTYKRGSFEQDVILREQPPSPAVFGMNPKTTRLQVWTEFLNAPTPKVKKDRNGSDQRLDFGVTQMERGQAFSTVGISNAVPVSKQWVTVGQRTCLLEEIPLDSVASQIQALPVSPGGASPGAPGGTNGSGGFEQIRFQGFPKALPPAPKLADRGAGGLKLAQNTADAQPGLVMDYIVVNASVTNFTFQGDTTYFVNGPLSLYGLTTIEGGAIVKYTNSLSNPGSLTVFDDLRCLTTPYQPAIFTSSDDNTAGTTLPASTGSPAISLASTYLYWYNAGTVSNLNFAYAWNAYAGGGGDIQVWDCQFVKCSHPLTAVVGNTNMGIHNVLITMVDTINNSSNFCGCPPGAITGYSADLNLYAENITADLQSQYFIVYFPGGPTPTNVVVSLTNSVVISPHLNPYYSYGAPVGNSVSTNCTLYSSTPVSGLFQVAGAGNYYLGTNSSYRNAGTTNINPALLARLAKKTTYPPIYLTNLINGDTTLNPQAQRDYDTPDLGYHYDPLDYLAHCIVTNATVTLTNGVVVANYDTYATWLQDGSALVSKGGPTQRNIITYMGLVQEQRTVLSTNGITIAGELPINTYHTNLARNPNITLRFTSLYAAQNTSFVKYTGSSNWDVGNFNMRDCEIYAAGDYWQMNDDAGSVIDMQNNLFRYAMVEVFSAAQVTTYNNLFAGNSNYEAFIFNTGVASYTNRDNAFDGCSVYLDGSTGHNAYLNIADTNTLYTIQPSDIITNLTWVIGPLGNYYQATNSPIINQGSRTADVAALYHYTVLTNEVKETNSIVDIGYHYVALDTNGVPTDSNGSGTPDYIENPYGPVCFPTPSGLVSWWKAENDAVDIISGNNGTLYNSATYTNGTVGQAFSLSGSAHIRVPDAVSLRVTNLTLEAWIYPTSVTPGVQYCVMGKWDAVGGPQARAYAMVIANDGRLYLTITTNGTATQFTCYSTNTISANQWTHAVSTYDGSTMKVYINGALNGTLSQSGPVYAGTDDFAIGGLVGGLGAGGVILPFAGRIDEASVYNRALSASEIQALFFAGSSGKCGTGPYDPGFQVIITKPKNNSILP